MHVHPIQVHVHRSPYSRELDGLCGRVRRLPSLRGLSDTLILALLSNCEPHPDRVGQGVVLFHEGDPTSCWYLLLSGEVELFLPAAHPLHSPVPLRSLCTGAIFGQLTLPTHPCSARVTKPAEFVRIQQKDFVAVYNKHADLLHLYITVMQDLIAEYQSDSLGLQATQQQEVEFGEAGGDFIMPSAACVPSPSATLPRLPIGAQLENSGFGNNITGVPPHSHLSHPTMGSVLPSGRGRFAMRDLIEAMPNGPHNGGVPHALHMHQSTHLDDPPPPPPPTHRPLSHSRVLRDTEIVEGRMDGGLAGRYGHRGDKWGQDRDRTDTHEHNDNSIIEFNNSISFDARMQEVGELLLYTMLTRTPGLVRERGSHGRVYPRCMVGTEMVDWLLELSLNLGANSTRLSRFQISGMWQTLLEHNVIHHVTNEQQFMDKHVFYRWVADPEQVMEQRAAAGFNSICFVEYDYPTDEECRSVYDDGVSPIHGSPMSIGPRRRTFVRQRSERGPATAQPTHEELSAAVFFLSTVGPDALFRMILGKGRSERCPEELQLVFEELLHVKALSHLSTMVKRELASVIGFEQHQHAGTVLFHQGDPGTKWYIILKGSVDVSVREKGVVCCLQEGDDFGKLAVVNESPRAATVVLREDNSQFLTVHKRDFNRILRDVEANTVRLSEHGQDVLVLEKIREPRGAAIDTTGRQCCYSVMAGLPEKMIEYVLETRMDAQSDDVTNLDPFLEDFILTHIIYMPANELCNYLKAYYNRKTPLDDRHQHLLPPPIDDTRLTHKRRAVSFLYLWVRTSALNFFIDPAANSFVEEMFCCVLDDAKCIPRMDAVARQMAAVREIRESAMRVLSRHPLVILECGVYSSLAPAPSPILPSDTCNQIIHLSDNTSFAMSIRVDKSAEEICELARVRVRYASGAEALCLVELKSSGERVVFAPTDISIPTMLSLNSKLYVCYRDEIEHLMPQPDQHGPLESVHASVMEFVSSSELAQQLALMHSQLFEATHESELITQVVGRDQFAGRQPSNLDLLLRRFNEVQYWATSEVLLAVPAKRAHTLRKFIKIALYAKENRDLMSLFAVTLGLSNIAVSRLNSLWEKLPSKLRRQFAELESLLDPTRNHRPYRALVSKMAPPLVPFVPLLLKDLTFIHEGNKTYYSGIVNFEKMHMIANVLRSFRQCKSSIHTSFNNKKIYETQNLIRNLRVIDNQRRLMEISYQIEPRRAKRTG